MFLWIELALSLSPSLVFSLVLDCLLISSGVFFFFFFPAGAFAQVVVSPWGDIVSLSCPPEFLCHWSVWSSPLHCQCEYELFVYTWARLGPPFLEGEFYSRTEVTLPCHLPRWRMESFLMLCSLTGQPASVLLEAGMSSDIRPPTSSRPPPPPTPQLTNLHF